MGTQTVSNFKSISLFNSFAVSLPSTLMVPHVLGMYDFPGRFFESPWTLKTNLKLILGCTWVMSRSATPVKRSPLALLRAQAKAMDIQEEEWVMATMEMENEEDRQNQQNNHEKRGKIALSYVKSMI
jgi:hypothetical protein